MVFPVCYRGSTIYFELMFCVTQSIHCDVLRMLVPAYDLLFGKLALRCLFEDYFEQPRHLNTRIMLKPLEDPNVDLIATVSIVVIFVA